MDDLQQFGHFQQLATGRVLTQPASYGLIRGVGAGL